MKKYEKALYAQGYRLVAGLDEVGRGCIAGPLVSAICILPPDYVNAQIQDSKKLSAKMRQKLSDEIKEVALAYYIQEIAPEIVDKINPKQASILAMEQSVVKLKLKPDFLLIDFEKINTTIPSQSLVKGDNLSQSIAAAAILAKVFRDELMSNLGQQYPEYGFENHKGYLTLQHRRSLQKLGPIAGVHRFSYKPIKQ